MNVRTRIALGLLASVAWCTSLRPANAAVHQVAISPPANLALNLGTTIYPGDHALELSPRNENNQPASTASGGALSLMNYDDVTNMLSFDFGYGSTFGFTDLTGNWSDVHIYGSNSVTANFPALNTNSGVIISLVPFHTPSGTRSGRVAGSVALTAERETWLFDHKLYFNVHSATFGGGEIRGQLVIIPEPATLGLAAAGALALVVAGRRKKSA